MFLVDSKEMQQLFGVTAASLTHWRKAGMPIFKRGSRGNPSQFDAAACIQWYMQREIERQIGKVQADEPERLNVAVERARETKERADKWALENAEKRGELVKITEVERDMVTKVRGCRSRLLAIPTKAAPLVAGCTTLKEIQSLLTDLVDDALRQLSSADSTG